MINVGKQHRRWISVILTFVLLFIAGCGNQAEPDNNVNGRTTKPEAPDKGTIADNVNQHKKKVHSMMKKMSLEEKVGQLLMPDFRKWDGKNVTVINDGVRSMIRDYHLGGVILFRENLVDRSQTKLLIESMQKEAKIPLLIGVDQEGGLVTRVTFSPRMPGNMALGATNDPEWARKVGLAIGSDLNDLGIHVNFGPVLDINNNPNNPVIGVRSFGDNAEIVSTLGSAYAKGLNEAGVAAVGKHFPGHGDVDTDSHYFLPKNNKTYDQLLQLELKPFKHLIDLGIQGMMTAHITFDSIESETVKSKKDGMPVTIPATLSKKIQTDILRNDFGFKGVLFTDAMDMSAISDHFGSVDAAIRAIKAGEDVIVMPVDVKRVYEGILDAIKSKELSEDRIDESVERILLLKLGYVYENDRDVKKIDINEALEIEQEVANASITVVSDEGVLPFSENEEETIALVATNQTDLTRLEGAVKTHNWREETVLISSSSNSLGNLTSSQKQGLKSVDKIVVATNISTAKDKEWQLKTVQSILNLDIPTIVVAARNPYDMNNLKGYKAFIAQYDNGVASFNATGNVLFGQLEAKGKLPVQLR